MTAMSRHTPTIVERINNEYGVICDECSHAAGDYTRCGGVESYPARLVDATRIDAAISACDLAAQNSHPTGESAIVSKHIRAALTGSTE